MVVAFFLGIFLAPVCYVVLLGWLRTSQWIQQQLDAPLPLSAVDGVGPVDSSVAEPEHSSSPSQRPKVAQKRGLVNQ